MYKFLAVSLIGLGVSFINFWIWRIIKIDIILGLTLVFLSISLIYIINVKFNKQIFLFTLFLILFISYKTLISGFDKNLITLNPDQEKQLGGRHGFLAINLGKLVQNKFALRFYKDVYPYINVYGSNIFNSLSPNLYFFTNHPREREKVAEFAKYPSILIAPFLVGLIALLKSSKYLMGVYLIFAVGITGFINQTYLFGPILFFPLINLLITIGFLQLINFFKK